MTLTKEQILELLQPKVQTDEALTAREFEDLLGCSRYAVQKVLRNLFNQGFLELAGTRRSLRIDGQPAHLPTYRFTPAFHASQKKTKTSAGRRKKAGKSPS